MPPENRAIKSQLDTRMKCVDSCHGGSILLTCAQQLRDLLFELIHNLVRLPLLQDEDDGSHHLQVQPQGALAMDVLTDSGVEAVLDAGPLLLGTHLVDLRHRGHQAKHLLKPSEDELHAKHLLVKGRPPKLLQRFNGAAEVLVHVARHSFEVVTVEPPPHLEAQSFGAHAAPIKNAQL